MPPRREIGSSGRITGAHGSRREELCERKPGIEGVLMRAHTEALLDAVATVFEPRLGERPPRLRP